MSYLNLSLLNYLNAGKNANITDYFAAKAASYSSSSAASSSSSAASSESAYKKVDLASIDKYKQPKDKLAIVAQAISNVNVQMQAMAQTGFYTRADDISKEADKIADAVEKIADEIAKKDGKTDGSGTNMKAVKKVVANILGALNSIQKSLTSYQSKVPTSQASEIKSNVADIIDTIKNVAKLAGITIKTSDSSTSATVSDPSKIVDISV